jgi:hypothetical protein
VILFFLSEKELITNSNPIRLFDCPVMPEVHDYERPVAGFNFSNQTICKQAVNRGPQS